MAIRRFGSQILAGESRQQLRQRPPQAQMLDVKWWHLDTVVPDELHVG